MPGFELVTKTTKNEHQENAGENGIKNAFAWLWEPIQGKEFWSVVATSYDLSAQRLGLDCEEMSCRNQQKSVPELAEVSAR
jgi:hypothetical protein